MRIARRLAHALIIVLTLVIGATAAAIIVTQTAWFKDWLRGYIVREANRYLNGQISIQRLGGNLFFGLELENVGVSMDGSEVVAVKDLGLDYSVFELISTGMAVDEIRLNKPVLYLRREGETWSISRLIKKQEQEADREGPAYPISISAIGISDASVVVDDPVGTSGVDVPNRFERIDAELSFKYEPVRYSIEIAHVSFRGSEPAIGLNALSGGIAVRDDTVFVEQLALRTEESSISVGGAVQQYLTKPVFNFQVSSDKLSLPEIARLVPALAGVQLQPAFELKLDGPLDRLGVEANVRSSAGDVIGRLMTDLLEPNQAVKGEISVRHLDLAPILKDPQQKSDLTANARVDVRAAAFSDVNSVRGTVDLDAPRIVAAGYTAENIRVRAQIAGRRVDVQGRATAYGTAATARGRVTLGTDEEPLSYDLRGSARGLDLRRLPRSLNVPPAATDVNADYHVRGAVPQRVARGFQPRDRRPALRQAQGTPSQSRGERAALRDQNSASERTAQPQRIDANLRFDESTVAGARIEAGSTAAVSMRGEQISYEADATVSDLDLQRVGTEFRIPALATDRYKSTLNARITASGRGRTPSEMEVKATGQLTDSTVLGGRLPELSFDANIASDTAHVKAAGAFAGFDPAIASGKPAMQGSIGGTLDVDATVAGLTSGVTADNVEGTARVTLEPSTIGGLAITKANIDGDYRNRSGEIRTLEIVGRDLNVDASGTLALNDTGQSNLKFHADTPSLEEIGKLVNRPLTGIASIDGTITGNRSELQASGTLIGNGVKYGENGALTLSTKYDARVPDLTVERASVEADSAATFVTVGGQNINELTAKTTYTGNRVEFEATAEQPERSVGATGAVTLHPDHQEIHLQRLALDTKGVQWQLAPGSEATVNYGGEAVAVKDLRLVSGDQQIAAEGAFGRPGDTLKVTLTNVDLASVDALMLRPPQLSGRLDAAGIVSGTKGTPEVKGDFQVNQGGFRQFKYDTLGGTVSYAARGLTVDARLQQNPTQWITAKGYLPAALFRGANAQAAGGASGTVASDKIDFVIDSSPIDLGLVQGFTTALTEVKGTLEAHVRVTGTADDPQPEGAITVQDGAMKVEPTGVTYTNIAGKVDLQPDKVHIDQFTVLDNHFSALSITGDLAINERKVGGVQLYVNAEDFKVVDNDLGNVRVQSSLEIDGELRAPRVGGYFGVTTGEIDLDEIIALTGPSAYATKPTEYTTPPADAAGEPPAPSIFDALTMDVHVTVPNDLVVRADSLQAPGSPISLGALNVTLGGDLRAMKDRGGRVRVVGAVNTVRGNYDFQGRRFEILRDGTVRFAGLDELNPSLDLRTRRLIQGVEARVNVRGTLKQPEIVLSSTPPLEQADILALIVFNQPLNQLGEGQQISLAQRAQALAAGAVAGQLAQSIGDALDLDTFEINLAPETGGGPQLTIGQQLGQNLYLKVQQGVGEQSMTNFVLEYEITQWLRLQSNVLQGSTTQQSLFRRVQGSGADLIFFFSY